MRPLKTLLALSIALVALMAATSASATAAPYVEISAANGHPDSFTITGSVDTNGLAAEVWVNYFPINLTTDCTALPHPDDMMAMQPSNPVMLDADTGLRPVSVDVTGLPHESDYCYQLAVRDTNFDESTTLMWSVDTTAPPPLLENATYDASTNSIDYAVSLTANTGIYFAHVESEYFAKGAESCAAYAGATISADYWGPGWNGFQGFSPQPVGTTISGLSTDTTYCFRLKAHNGHSAATPTAWQEVSTISPVAATATGVKLAPPSSGNDANLKFTIDDNGAAVAEGTDSSYDAYLYDVGAGRCNSADYFGGTMVVGWGGDFAGEMDFDAGVDGLVPGKPYCATVFVNSAWGASYDAAIHQEVWFGEAPQIDLNTPAASHDSISVPGTDITPGHLATDYSLEYFAKQSGVACAADSTTLRLHGATLTISTNLGVATTVAPAATGLTPQTTYCLRVIASNYWGDASTVWDSIRTKKQPVKATITNLRFGPNTGNGAQLSQVMATLDDGAPFESMAAVSTYSLQTFVVAAPQCNAGGVSGVAPTDDFSNFSMGQAGTVLMSHAVGSGGVGQTICARVTVFSAFGQDYDELAFLWFKMPGKPAFDSLALSSSKTSLTVDGDLGATFAETDFHIEWFEPAAPGCDAAPSTAGSDQPFTPNDADGSVSATATGLTPGTRYCARLVASNDWGSSDDFYQEVTTVEATPPSVPTGLAQTGVGQTAATLTWNASSDADSTVTGYRVFEGATEVASPTGTSYNVALTCGQSRTFTVSAVDANSNESAASAPFAVTAAACPVVVPPTPALDPTAGPPCTASLIPFREKAYRGSTRIGKKGKTKKFKVRVTSQAVATSLKVSVRVSGVNKSKVSLSFEGKKLGRSAMLDRAGTLKLTLPKGKKGKTTKKIKIDMSVCPPS